MKAKNNYGVIIHLIWLGMILLGLWYFFNFGKVVSDISQFMPRTSSHAQLNILLKEMQQGAASGYLLVRLEAESPTASAKHSRELKQYLNRQPFYTKVQNGDQDIDVNDFKSLYHYRFILTAETAYSPVNLRQALEQRLSDLRSGMGILLKQTLTSDPQNHFLTYLQHLSARGQPNRHLGVWFDQENQGAMLLVTLAGEGFDLNQQEQAINHIKKYVGSLPNTDRIKLDISGPAVMAVATRAAIRSTMQTLSYLAGGLMVVLFLWGYRSVSRFFIAGLPLASAILAAMVITNLAFGQVHGIVMAFGITLLGVCLDFPLHLFSHLVKHETPAQTLRSIWPTLRLSVLTTAFSYMAMLGTDFSGLSQLAVFAVAGLFAALAVTRWIVPLWLSSASISHTIRPIKIKAPAAYKRSIIIMGVVLPVTILLARADQIWSQDISRLSPIPEAARVLDQTMRAQLSAPEVSHAFFVQASASEALLQKVEALASVLTEAKTRGLVKHIFAVTDILPSQKTQSQRQAQLPDKLALTHALDQALTGLPFKREAFDEFLSDVEASKTIRPLAWQGLQQTPLAESLRQDFFMRDGQWYAIIRLAGISDEPGFMQWLQARPVLKAHYVNMRSASSELMQDYQHTALARLLIGMLIMAGILLWVSRSGRAMLRLILPILLAVLTTISLQVAMGTSLTLFHILALLLVVGMGLDYSLFFNRPITREQDLNMRTHGVMMSAGSTLATFGVLAFAKIPVLAAMGQTVSIGVLCCYVLAQLLAEPVRQN